MHSCSPPIDELPAPDDVGELGVFQLKRLWARNMAACRGVTLGNAVDRQADYLVIHASGLGLEQTMQFFRNQPSFEDFEQWVADTTGGIALARVARINAAICGTAYPEKIQQWLAEVETAAPVLSADDLAFWDKHGYVVVHDAISADGCAAAEQAIWDHIGASADDQESWYRKRNNGIMVQFFQHPAFEANRQSRRIHKAFAQLWKTADLWVTTDRCGFNVPERPNWTFPGPHLHWDVSLQTPIPFGTQGILYLTDTPPEQGAFTLVPSFHRRVESWLASLPPGANPREQDLHALGSQPIGGQAGDLIIWHHALPHGSRPNRGTRPRIVQYIDMFPTRREERENWI